MILLFNTCVIGLIFLVVQQLVAAYLYLVHKPGTWLVLQVLLAS